MDAAAWLKLAVVAVVSLVRRIRRRHQRPGKHRRPNHHD